MNNFSTEILQNIFTRLPRESKLECAVVCISWSTAALPILNSSISLRNTNDTSILFEKLRQMNNAIQGSAIRHLSLYDQCSFNDEQINRLIFKLIFEQCTGLTMLEMTGVHRDNYHLQLLINYRDTMHLDSLQCIDARSKDEYYLLANWHHHQNISRLHLSLTDNTFNGFEYASNMIFYLGHFRALKILHLTLHCTINIHNLLSVCPQLESLQVENCFSSRQNHLKVSDGTINLQQIAKHLQLRYLKLSTHYINQELFEYIRYTINNLTQLTVEGSDSYTPTNISNAFNPALALEATLPIKLIEFTNSFGVTHDVIQGLNTNFRRLRHINFTDCRFYKIMDQNGNYMLDFDQLDLEYLSIDLAGIMLLSRPFGVLSLVIHTDDLENAVFYHKDGKWDVDYSFMRSRASTYFSTSAYLSRLPPLVITIKASALGCLHTHFKCNFPERRFSQFIRLN